MVGKYTYHTISNQKKAGLAQLTSDMVDFRTRNINKQDRFVGIKESISKGLIIFNVYALMTEL